MLLMHAITPPCPRVRRRVRVGQWIIVTRRQTQGHTLRFRWISRDRDHPWNSLLRLLSWSDFGSHDLKVTERKLGRVFHLQLEAGDDFFANVNPFIKEKNIRAGTVFIFGALRQMDMITGFKSMTATMSIGATSTTGAS